MQFFEGLTNNFSTCMLLSGSTVMMIIMFFIPKYTYTNDMPSIFLCIVSITFNSILISHTQYDSWLAVSFWLLSGIILFIRCDVWCCLCLDVKGSDQIIITDRRNSKVATTIRLQNPPKNMLVTQMANS